MKSEDPLWRLLFRQVRNLLLASCITYVLASIFHSQYVVGRIERMGVPVALLDRVRMTVGDLTGLYVYLLVITIGIVAAFTVMSGVRRLTGLNAWVVYPLGGCLAMAAIMVAMNMAFPMTPLAPARDMIGVAGQCLSGLAGGLAFARLQDRRP